MSRCSESSERGVMHQSVAKGVRVRQEGVACPSAAKRVRVQRKVCDTPARM